MPKQPPNTTVYGEKPRTYMVSGGDGTTWEAKRDGKSWVASPVWWSNRHGAMSPVTSDTLKSLARALDMRTKPQPLEVTMPTPLTINDKRHAVAEDLYQSVTEDCGARSSLVDNYIDTKTDEEIEQMYLDAELGEEDE